MPKVLLERTPVQVADRTLDGDSPAAGGGDKLAVGGPRRVSAAGVREGRGCLCYTVIPVPGVTAKSTCDESSVMTSHAELLPRYLHLRAVGRKLAGDLLKYVKRDMMQEGAAA